MERVSRLQMPHLVAAKSADDEVAHFVSVSLKEPSLSYQDAKVQWFNAISRAPCLRTRFVRRGRDIGQQLLPVTQCLDRCLVVSGDAGEYADIDSFAYPSLLFWDPSTRNSELRIHHALVDSVSVGRIRASSRSCSEEDYLKFLRRVEAVSDTSRQGGLDVCAVSVTASGSGEGIDSVRMIVDREHMRPLLKYGEFNFWFWAFADALSSLDVVRSGRVLVPMTFRDLLEEYASVPGLAMGSVAVDLPSKNASALEVRRLLMHCFRHRAERLAVGSWSGAGTVPIQFAYDDSPVRLNRMRHQAGSAGFEVVKESEDTYLFVCSAGAEASFTDFTSGEVLQLFVECVINRGLRGRFS